MNPMKPVIEAVCRARLMHDQDQQEVVVMSVADFECLRNAVAVPNGWKMVPVQMTEQMQDAFYDILKRQDAHGTAWQKILNRVDGS